MQLPDQKDFERIDEEVDFVTKKNGKFGVKSYLDWLELRGGIRQQLNGDSFIVTNQFEEGKFLYEVLVRRFEQWQQWKKYGRKINNLSNFNIDESKNTQSENKEVAQGESDLQTDFDEDIAEAFGRKNQADL